MLRQRFLLLSKLSESASHGVGINVLKRTCNFLLPLELALNQPRFVGRLLEFLANKGLIKRSERLIPALLQSRNQPIQFINCLINLPKAFRARCLLYRSKIWNRNSYEILATELLHRRPNWNI